MLVTQSGVQITQKNQTSTGGARVSIPNKLWAIQSPGIYNVNSKGQMVSAFQPMNIWSAGFQGLKNSLSQVSYDLTHNPLGIFNAASPSSPFYNMTHPGAAIMNLGYQTSPSYNPAQPLSKALTLNPQAVTQANQQFNTTLLNDTTAPLTDTYKYITQGATTIYHDISSGASTIYHDISSGASTLYHNVSNAVSSMGSDIGKAILDFLSQYWWIFAIIIGVIVAGIIGYAYLNTSMIRSIAQGAAGAAGSGLGSMTA